MGKLFHPMRLNLAGRRLAESVEKILKERAYTFRTSAERELVHNDKERLAYVPLDFKAELQKSTTADCNVSDTLPDGNEIIIADKRFQYPKLLLKLSSPRDLPADGDRARGVQRCRPRHPPQQVLLNSHQTGLMAFLIGVDIGRVVDRQLGNGLVLSRGGWSEAVWVKFHSEGKKKHWRGLKDEEKGQLRESNPGHFDESHRSPAQCPNAEPTT
jgi:hypothetical protein